MKSNTAVKVRVAFELETIVFLRFPHSDQFLLPHSRVLRARLSTYEIQATTWTTRKPKMKFSRYNDDKNSPVFLPWKRALLPRVFLIQSERIPRAPDQTKFRYSSIHNRFWYHQHSGRLVLSGFDPQRFHREYTLKNVDNYRWPLSMASHTLTQCDHTAQRHYSSST